MEISAADADLSSRIVQPMVRYVRARFGADAVARVASAAGLPAAALDGKPVWLSAAQVAQVFSACREMLRDDDEFIEGSRYELRESYGVIGYLLRTVSVERLYQLMARSMFLVSRVSQYEVTESTHTSMRLRYSSRKLETRLTCLARRTQLTTAPTLYGLPKASVVERCCIADGAPCCDYELRWAARASWSHAALGLLAGAGVGGLLSVAAQAGLLEVLALSALGAAIAWIGEQRRANDANLRSLDELTVGIRDVIADSEEARLEVLAHSGREAHWAALLEQQAEDRTAMLHDIIEQLRQLGDERVLQLRGAAHDLRNPLAVLHSCSQLLERAATDAERSSLLGDIRLATEQLDRQFAALLASAKLEGPQESVAPERIAIAPAVERIRRRLRAFLQGRPVQGTVTSTREAPEAIEIDPLVFERVIDNLLTNAAKYTRAGSIQVEITGVPEMLCLKVADTGPGIDEAAIAAIFRHGDAGAPRAANSFGVGLAGTVRLLDRVGGRLEVLSKPGVGSTFWAYFPVAPREGHASEAHDDVVSRVVRIRQ